LHEYRTATLATMAELSGHHCQLAALRDGSRPDVLRLRLTDGSLFVGDAKATETPGNTATFVRLDRYAACMTEWLITGCSATLALIVPEVDAFGWLRVLRDLAVRPSGGTRIRGSIGRIECGTMVVWQSFVGARAYASAAADIAPVT
jgi:hypothetical protein